tara:strand:- start:70 stop:522 length:453 start_codon:yes stop_codon:yes gene_type:complete
MTIVSVALAQTALAEGPNFIQRTPDYFIDRYGTPKMSQNVQEVSSLHEKHGMVKLKGRFNVREFFHGQLHVRAIFALPSLTLISVRLDVPAHWRAERIEAALSTYGSNWRKEYQGEKVKTWKDSKGLKAVLFFSTLEIQSPNIATRIRRL